MLSRLVASTVSPLSTKLTGVAAGAFGLPFAQLFLALLIGRAIRFAVLTLVLRSARETPGAAVVRPARLTRTRTVDILRVAHNAPSGAGQRRSTH